MNKLLSNVIQKKDKKISKKPRSDSKVFKFVFSILIVLLILAITTIGWTVYKTQKQARLFKTTLKSLENNQKELSQNVHLIETDTKNIQKQIFQIKKLASFDHESWVLLEVQYLINLANINTTISDNVPGALKLLQLADKQILILSNPSFDQLRKVLIQDIDTLKNVPKVDTVGIITQLNFISSQISSFSPIPIKFKEDTQSKGEKATKHQLKIDKDETTSDKSFWHRFDEFTINKLKNVVVLKRRKVDTASILNDEYQVYMTRKIQIMIEQIKWALIQKNEKLYKNYIQNTIKIIKLKFAYNLVAIKSILDTLNSLEAVNINPQIPDISNAKIILNKILKQSPKKAI